MLIVKTPQQQQCQLLKTLTAVTQTTEKSVLKTSTLDGNTAFVR